MTRSRPSPRNSSRSQGNTTSVGRLPCPECQVTINNIEGRFGNFDTRLIAIEHADIRTADRLTAAEKTHTQFEATQQEILKRLEAIEKDLTKYRGAWGTVMMVVTAVWAAIVVFKDYVSAHWK